MSCLVLIILLFLRVFEGRAAECAGGAVQLRVSAEAARNASASGWQLAAAASSDVAARPGARVAVEAQLSAGGGGQDDACAGAGAGCAWAAVGVTARVDAAPLGYEPMPFSPKVKSLCRMHALARPWAAAAAACQGEGAHLLVLNSAAEALLVLEFFGRKPAFVGATNPGWFYVGATRHAGRNVTVLGGDVEATGYARWAPDGWALLPSSLCAIVDARALLAFDACHSRRPFICEREP